MKMRNRRSLLVMLLSSLGGLGVAKARAVEAVKSLLATPLPTGAAGRDASRPSLLSIDSHSTVTHEYDSHGRVVSSEFRDRSGKVSRAEYHYDGRDHLVSAPETSTESGEPRCNQTEGETY